MRRYVGVVAVLLLLVAIATAASIDRHEKSRGDEVKREKRQAATCENKYAVLDGHTLCMVDNEDAIQVELDDDMKEYIVHLHNYYRCVVEPTAADMQLLVWDEKLERTAKKWAMQCPLNHDINREEPDWNFLSIGQNIGLGHATWEIMLDRFFTENTRKNYTYGENFTNDGYGHYLQMVTAQTVRVGCGQAYCPNSDFKHFRVCNYALCMDVSNPPYKNGTSCSACPDTCSPDYSLCDCGGKLCLNGGTLNPNTCECECTEFYIGENCSENNCVDPDTNGCQFSSYSQCGVAGFVKDEAMCPHLCRICPACDGMTCETGRTLNETTCECQCSSDSKGEFCELDCTYCENDGIGDPLTCECACPPFTLFYGKLCEKECTAKDCNDNGDPKIHDGKCECDCYLGFIGASCEVVCKDQPICSTFAATGYCSFGNANYQCDIPSFAAYCPVCCSSKTHCPV